MKKLFINLLPLICLISSCGPTSPADDNPFKQGDIPPGTTYKVGDTMYDYTLVDLEGDSHTFSEIVKSKELLILNFFFTTCGPCQIEFPYLQQVYEEVKDDVEILAIDPTGEDYQTVYDFIYDRGYTFPVSCENKTYILRSTFALEGYPTSVVINKEGVILDIHTGTLNTYELMYNFVTEYLE